MKNFLFASVIVLGTIGLSSCGDNTHKTDENEVVVDENTRVSEVEVERTTVEMDTTTSTETVDVEKR